MTESFSNRLAYFPRTPPEKSYSGSISSGSCLGRAFLILYPFASGARSKLVVSQYGLVFTEQVLLSCSVCNTIGFVNARKYLLKR